MTRKPKTHCTKCGKLVERERTYDGVCDACTGIKRGRAGTPIDQFAVTDEMLQNGHTYYKVHTGEPVHYTGEQMKAWLE